MMFLHLAYKQNLHLETYFMGQNKSICILQTIKVIIPRCIDNEG